MRTSHRFVGVSCLLLVWLSNSVSSFTATQRLASKSLISKTYIRAESDDDGDISLEAFQARKHKQEEEAQEQAQQSDLDEFDGYAMRDAILEKWGQCFDVDFNRVESFGFKNVYLNVLPFCLGGRRFRHETELDYLCHLQAVVEILQKYDQVRTLVSCLSFLKYEKYKLNTV
jgi:hypothetical protein